MNTLKREEEFISSLTNLIKRVCSDMPARIVPSLRECGMCDHTNETCDARLEAVEIECTTDDF